MMKAAQQLFEELASTGTQAAFMDRMQTRQELYRLIDYAGYEDMDSTISRKFEE
jgi:methylisocitrate lyase